MLPSGVELYGETARRVGAGKGLKQVSPYACTYRGYALNNAFLDQVDVPEWWYVARRAATPSWSTSTVVAPNAWLRGLYGGGFPTKAR
jgi:hypothetical protein